MREINILPNNWPHPFHVVVFFIFANIKKPQKIPFILGSTISLHRPSDIRTYIVNLTSMEIAEMRTYKLDVSMPSRQIATRSEFEIRNRNISGYG